MSDEPAPIIIKRKKVIAGSHHGGAWKVAYADFVTAMMAFFLLMWLLGATTEKQRKGIADYFNPTIPINKSSGGGSGAFGGDSIFSENTLTKSGTGAATGSGALTELEDGAAGADPDGEESAQLRESGPDPMEEMVKMLAAKTGDSILDDLIRKHVIIKLSDEGLIVEVFDLPDAPLFDAEEQPTAVLNAISRAIVEVFNLTENGTAVQGHTASVPLATRINPVWEKSASRADRVRQLLTEEGLPAERMKRVSGFADRELASTDPLSERNNRIEVILLRNSF